MKCNKFASTAMRCLYLTLALMMLGTVSQAATITNLYNTGVNNGGVAIGPNLPDPHYSLIVQPGSTTATTVDDTMYPIPPWVANNAGSRWIGPSDPFADGPTGNYVYRTTFTLPANANLSTVNVSGWWGTDNQSIDILINGSSTGNVSAGFTTLVPFNVSSGFVIGNNTLDFSLNNAGGPTGLRVDRMVGTYQVIPEPGALQIAIPAFGICLAKLQRRRKTLR